MVAVSCAFDPKLWNAAVAAHTAWERRLHELAPAAVLGSRPIDFSNQGYNEPRVAKLVLSYYLLRKSPAAKQ